MILCPSGGFLSCAVVVMVAVGGGGAGMRVYGKGRWRRGGLMRDKEVRRRIRGLSVCAIGDKGGMELINPTGRRVVVTGTGIVSSLGHSSHDMYTALLAGQSGISHIEKFDTVDFPTRFAGEIKGFDCGEYVPMKEARRLDEYIKYIIVSGRKALESAGLELGGRGYEALDLERCGVVIGSAMGGMQTFSTAVETLTTAGHRRMSPFCIPYAMSNGGVSSLGIQVGFMGPNYSLATACATGNFCILNSVRHIQRGDCDVMLAGASDSAVVPSGMGGFSACKALSTRNDDPHAASRPWDCGRDGFVMGEGAGVLVLEELGHAVRRGANILAEVAGGYYTCDAYHLTEPRPDGEGVKRCIEEALRTSGVEAAEVDYVNAHATSTPAGDIVEYKAITSALHAAKNLKMNSTKSMLGHLLGAAGAVEAAVCVEAIQRKELHPTINLASPDSHVDMDIIVGGAKQKHDVKVALSNSFGFGGHNSALVFRRYDEDK